MIRRTLFQCQRCRHGVIESFTSLAGVSIQPLSTRTPVLSSRNHTVTQTRRSITTSPTYRQSDSPAVQSDQSSHQSNQNNPLPWYLQVETPTPLAPTSPHLALQEIPPIPSDAPQILSPILNHLSNHIGLDNLALLDLRHLDPPPALGANLIMIIGTARSYKHLNTSADRFCRWLRSRYKLSPYADGLLGRNELKLKLRRKARKMKLAQSVGNTVVMNNADDGITTGWICVNMGTVDNARIPAEEKIVEEQGLAPSQTEQEELNIDEEEYENPADEDGNTGYVGFGSRSTAPRIVVQMFIEEKRLEMDLEGLWDYRQERRAQKAERSDAEARQNIQYTAADTEQGDESTQSTTGFKPWAQ